MVIPPGLALSFQRFQWPEGGVVDRAPQSLGALPVGLGPARELLLPLAEDEGFWIGLGVEPQGKTLALAVAAELSSGTVLDALSGAEWNSDRPTMVVVADTPRIEGIARPDKRLQVLARKSGSEPGSGCVAVRLRMGAATPGAARDGEAHEIRLRLVDYATYGRETGCPPPDPLDPDAGYKGWMLP